MEDSNALLSEFRNIIIKNNIKKIINFFIKNKYQIVKPKKVFIDHISLNDLIQKSTQDVNILKVDAEGYQANFLPPASRLLIKKNFVILLEFDDIKELRKFDSSNRKICDPFIENGYKLYWFNHRIKGSKLELRTNFDNNMETNSFGLLMPPRYDRT